jgi:5'-nucleotidase
MNNTDARPLILVSNDDGIFSKGIKALVEVAQRFGRVEVVAPDRPQSAVGHAITILDPLRVSPFQLNEHLHGHAVSGTPADCVKLAHDKLLTEKPALVLSGINHGSNAGINVIYSGTVSAATEGTILGYPSIAVSCTDFDADADLSGCQEAVSRVIPFVLKNGLPRGVTLNVNAPAGPMKGIRWTHIADSVYVDEFEKRVDPHNRPYYWMTGALHTRDKDENADLVALEHGFASVTPIHYDLTAYEVLKNMSGYEL